MAFMAEAAEPKDRAFAFALMKAETLMPEVSIARTRLTAILETHEKPLKA